MTANELREAAIELFGRRGWTTDLAACLKVDRTSVYRWTQGQLAVPGPVEAAVTCWLERLRESGRRPTVPKSPGPGEGSPPAGGGATESPPHAGGGAVETG